MAYSTRIKLKSRPTKRTRMPLRNYVSHKWISGLKKRKFSKLQKEKIKKVLFTAGAIGLVFVLIFSIYALSYVQSVTEELPEPDKPFSDKNASSIVYDRNGKQLYKLFDKENRDLTKLDEVPDLLEWSYIAAEDGDFYSHNGVDLTAQLRCAFRWVTTGEIACGGSTITQQLIKTTVLTNEKTIERKIKEIVLALQIEQERSKDEILEMYLNTVNEGSNVYGVKTAAKFYFNKNLDQLNLAEMTVLAAIINDPSRLSPTTAPNIETARTRLKERQNYILDQMAKHMDEINADIAGGDENATPALTAEMIEEARNFEVIYQNASIDIKAPHFVFFARDLLQQRDYNNGEAPFTLEELQKGGYKIYTTLDLDYQEIAEEQVKIAVDKYASKYGGENAALLAMNPKTGEILAMVGSKDWNAPASPEGCILGSTCKFESKVNVTTSKQSPGSSIKSFIYYAGIMEGKISAASIMADVPIKIGPYDPKNYEGGFTGMHPARWMLAQSRNIPAILIADAVGVDKMINDYLKKFGYSTLDNPQGYGPAIAVGGLDVTMVDHTQAYSVLANEGKFTEYEAILRIEDRNGNIVYEHKPVSEQVADARGVYIINDILNGRKDGPGLAKDKRDIAGKTGTAEDQEQTWFVNYTPEIVISCFVGNNNNAGMRFGASGFTTARPWCGEFFDRIAGSIPATPFNRPAGIVVGGSCTTGEDGGGCDGFGGDLAIADIQVPSYVEITTAEVCTDQTNRLAREIDKSLGLSQVIKAKYFKMLNPKMQSFLDAWLISKPEYGYNGVPTEYCDIVRNPNGTTKPWAVFTAPTNGAVLTGSTLQVQLNAFSPNSTVSSVTIKYDNTTLGTYTSLPINQTYTLTGGQLSPGAHTITAEVTDAAGTTGTTSVSIEILGTVNITSPGDGSTILNGATLNVAFSYSGAGALSNTELLIDGGVVASCSPTACSWVVAANSGDKLKVTVRGTRAGTVLTSGQIEITVI